VNRIKRLQPSPAMVVALIALFMAMGGVGYAAATIGSAQIKNNSVRGKDVKNYSLTGKDIKKNGIGGVTISESRLGTVPTAGALDATAVVNSGGATVRGRNVSSSARTGTGRYQVIFKRDVRACVYNATLGSISATAPPSGVISVSSLPSSVNGVTVRTGNDSNGNPANLPFHLIVSC
jgi:hypothetical protein